MRDHHPPREMRLNDSANATCTGRRRAANIENIESEIGQNSLRC